MDIIRVLAGATACCAKVLAKALQLVIKKLVIGFLSIHRGALRVGFYYYLCITFVWHNSKAAASGLPT
jgi:hypothetical protein